MNHWMMNCRKISRMVSDSMDRKLPFYQRWGIRIHLMMCRYCLRYRKQLLFLRKVIQQTTDWDDESGTGTPMPAAARERINASLQRHLVG